MFEDYETRSAVERLSAIAMSHARNHDLRWKFSKYHEMTEHRLAYSYRSGRKCAVCESGARTANAAESRVPVVQQLRLEQRAYLLI